MIHPSSESRPWRAARLAGDLAIGVGAFWLAFLLRVHVEIPFTARLLPADRLVFFAREWPSVVLAQLLALYFFGLYDPLRPWPRLELARRLLGAVVLQGLGLTGYYFFRDQAFPRSVLLLYVGIDFVLLFLWRFLLQRLHRLPERRIAIVGCGEEAREIAATVARLHVHGLRVAGWVPAPGEDPAAGEEVALLGPRLGTLDDLPDLLARRQIDDIVLAVSTTSWQTRLVDKLSAVRPRRAGVFLVPGPFESLIGRTRYRWIHDIPLIDVVRETEWRLNWPLKRAFDLALGSLLFLAALPLVAACAVVVRATSPGPILYRQTRIGRGQRFFTLLKFRTMRADAEADGSEVLAETDDPRLTPVGMTLRRLRLDELPQLWNVLAGEMSLVGPRPERPGFVQRYVREVPGYAERFVVAPGLTGLAQVNGDYHSRPRNKLRYDLAYIANWSVWLDLSILFRTVKIVLTSRGV